MRDPRHEKLADVLVRYSTNVKKGQIVRINGSYIGLPLILEVYRKVLEVGAHPLVRLGAGQFEEIFYKVASDEQIAFVNPIALNEIETIDASIGLWADENTRAMSNVDPAKMGAASKARRPIMDRFMARSAEGKLNWVGTQYPTQASAQDAEMSLSEYEDFVFNAGLLNLPDPVAGWKAVSEKQQRLVDFLNGKKDYRVVAANGTDVTMSLTDRKWINCDGKANFPDGEVFTGPVESSVNGTVVFSFPAVHHGRECDGVRLTFRDGKVVDATAAKGEAFLHSMLDTDEGSRFLGECAIGTNYGITRYTRNTLFDEKIGGTVHFALGAGYPETGNANQSGLHWDMVVDLRQGGHIEIDGKTFSENGRFLKDGFPNPTM